MSKVETTESDRKEIEKFTKHLIYKFVQVVVQSRLGARTATRSKQLASSDWFSISLPDRADVRDATRAAFGDQQMSLVEPLCVEIALRTNENETMTLEYWYLQLTDKTTLPDSNFTVRNDNFIGASFQFPGCYYLQCTHYSTKLPIKSTVSYSTQ